MCRIRTQKSCHLCYHRRPAFHPAELLQPGSPGCSAWLHRRKPIFHVSTEAHSSVHDRAETAIKETCVCHKHKHTSSCNWQITQDSPSRPTATPPGAGSPTRAPSTGRTAPIREHHHPSAEDLECALGSGAASPSSVPSGRLAGDKDLAT